MSYAKQKGTKYESDIIKYLFDCGFTTPRRIVLSGAAGDKGDIWLGENPTYPDIIIECKNYNKEYAYKLIEDFVSEAHIEYKNATNKEVNSYRALLFAKRVNLGVADSWLIWKNKYNVTVRGRLGDIINKDNFTYCTSDSERIIKLENILKNI